MEHENFAERIKPLFRFDTYVKPKKDTEPVVRISVKKGEMATHKIIKSKFSHLNDKRFYFPNDVVSLPFGHCVLKDLDDFKRSKGQRIEHYFLKEKEHLFELEKEALKKCLRLDFLNNILLQSFKVVNNNNPDRYLYNEKEQTVLDFILNAGWMNKNTPSMDNLKKISSKWEEQAVEKLLLFKI